MFDFDSSWHIDLLPFHGLLPYSIPNARQLRDVSSSKYSRVRGLTDGTGVKAVTNSSNDTSNNQLGDPVRTALEGSTDTEDHTSGQDTVSSTEFLTDEQ